jgi:NAD(P)-dependent dehydrogenase (short-subunit alcohol dehydrogenase family)
MLSDRVCIVAGGGHGIGKATAEVLGELGATVVINDLGTSLEGDGESEEPAEEVAASIRDSGGEAMAHFGDISSFEYTEELVADTVAEYGRVDGAVNFAGILRDSISYKMDPEDWDDVVRVHLRGHFGLLRNLGAHWRSVAADNGDTLESQRSFVAITSPSALGNIGQLNYGSAKAGILGMVRTAAMELDRYNIRVNALMPLADTRMTDSIPGRDGEDSDRPPERVGEVVGYLMSDAAEDVSGCTIRAVGDEVSLYSDPLLQRSAVKEGGWSASDLADEFTDIFGADHDLHRVEQRY